MKLHIQHLPPLEWMAKVGYLTSAFLMESLADLRSLVGGGPSVGAEDASGDCFCVALMIGRRKLLFRK